MTRAIKSAVVLLALSLSGCGQQSEFDRYAPKVERKILWNDDHSICREVTIDHRAGTIHVNEIDYGKPIKINPEVVSR